MIGYLVLLSTQAATVPATCSREAVEKAHVDVVTRIKFRVEKLVEERRSLLARRAELAKRSIKLAEMYSVERELSEAFGKNQADLERLDLAYTARINIIADEAGVIKSDIEAEQVRYSSDLNRCGLK